MKSILNIDKGMSADFIVNINDKGEFTGVNEGNKNYSIKEWNNIYKNKPVVQQEGQETGIPPVLYFLS